MVENVIAVLLLFFSCLARIISILGLACVYVLQLYQTRNALILHPVVSHSHHGHPSPRPDVRLLVKVVEPLVCKALTSPAVNSLPAGIFDPVTLPLQEMSASDNPSVHLFDVVIWTPSTSRRSSTMVLICFPSLFDQKYSFPGTPSWRSLSFLAPMVVTTL